MKYLLDINVLVAAIFRNHAQHSKADAWIKGKKLATCPISDLGFLRVGTHQKGMGSTMSFARQCLEEFHAKHAVELIAADLPALRSNARTSGETTDFYLAELAKAHSFKLATLDQGVMHPAVEVI